MDPEFIKWIVGQSGVVGIAALALLMLKKSYEERLEDKEDQRKREEERVKTEQVDKADLKAIVKENTMVMAQVRQVLDKVCSVGRND